MSREMRLFLLITPPSRPFEPIRAACTIVGKTDRMYGIGAEFPSAHELETRLAAAGLPGSEIDRAIQRLEMNHPTFSEISHGAAERLRLVEPCGDVEARSDTAGLHPCGSGASAISSTLPF